MKAGTYRVSFNVELNEKMTQSEAFEAVKFMCSEMIDEDEFPEVEFELVEELDLEYNTDEDEIPELNF